MAEPGLSEIVTTTGRLRSKVLKDNVKDSDPILVAMKKYGGMRYVDGGRTIVEEMSYAQNPSVKWYEGGEEFNMSSTPVLTAAEYNWKQLGGQFVITGKEKRQNSGKEAYIPLVASKMKVLEDTMQNQLHAGLLSDGSGSGGKQIAGAALLISKTPASTTVGGINRGSADGDFFQNFAFDTSSDWALGAITSSNVKLGYDKCINGTTRGSDKPTVAVAGQDHFEALMAAMQSIQRLEDPDLAEAGFENIVYRGVPVVFGGGISFSGLTLVQSDLTYFFNTKYYKLVTHKQADFEFLEDIQSINQDLIARLMIWMGAVTLSNGKAQAVIFDS
jgi:hypothetical protein